ncbi:MAG: mucoidy inhibitor MuiA family protein [Hyphomicrobiaceae bacterium]|nr:mucoidy inhibitor MuiA family protein [Hyphomicrobiaceae bacterium]
MRIAIAAASAILLAGSAHAAEISAQSKVDAVTVFPSGAEVIRVGKVKLEKGEHVIVFSDVPAQAAPNSIRVEGRSTGKFEIGSVDTRHLFVPRTDEAAAASERRRIEDELDTLRDARAMLDGQVLAAETQKTLIANLAQLPVRPAPPQVAAGSPPEDWARILALIGSGTSEAIRASQDAQVRMRDLDHKIEDLEKKLASIAPAREERTEVKVYVSAADALEADVSVRYQVPNASWIALYDARLATGTKDAPPKLDLTRRASISQNTGESWDDVTVVLSTTRPTAGAAAPELFPMTVDYVPEPKPVPVGRMDEQRTRNMAADRKAGGGFGAGDQDGMAAESAPMAASVPAPAPIVQDAIQRGALAVAAPFQALFAVPGRLTVPNTGEAKRVQLSEDSMEPQIAVRTVPKDDAKAYLYAKLVLPKGSPILPGTVALFRDGTFVGNGLLPVLSPGEEHELGFGIDDSVRVRHAIVEDKRGQTGLISSSKTDTRNYRITVKNLHQRPISLTLYDQIPASQNQDIKVERTGLAPTKENIDDKRGVLVWESKLDPEEEKIFEFGYRVSWPAAKAIEYGR